ncbi:unnamed protein product [Closterium sp. Yama58-4]|nr:unnamed protein product [Closterium sp. Yama58-4]
MLAPVHASPSPLLSASALPDTCEVKACVDGTCTQDVNGTASCHCDADAGLVLLDDERTCEDVCIIKDCEGSDANSTCVKNGTVATCVCKTGFELFEGKCIVGLLLNLLHPSFHIPSAPALPDTCEVKACVDGTCTQDVNGTASCHCDADAGLVLLDDERTCEDTCEVKACVDGTCTKDVNGTASCHCDADAGFVLLDDERTCKDVCLIEDCEGKDAKSMCVRNRDVAHCECVLNYELFRGIRPHFTALSNYLSLTPLHPSVHIPSAPALPDTCEVKACVNGLCRQDSSTGAVSCHCDADAGYVLLDDERTCKDVCIIKDCEGSDFNSTCVKNGTDATCICKTGFKLFEGKCIGMPALPATTPPLSPIPASSGAGSS